MDLLSWFNPTVDLGQVPLSGVITIVFAAVLFYWAMWRVRKDIKILTYRLSGLDTIDQVNRKLMKALSVIDEQTKLMKLQNERITTMERGVVEVAAATTATAAIMAEKAEKTAAIMVEKAEKTATDVAAAVALALEEAMQRNRPLRLAVRRNGFVAERKAS